MSWRSAISAGSKCAIGLLLLLQFSSFHINVSTLVVTTVPSNKSSNVQGCIGLSFVAIILRFRLPGAVCLSKMRELGILAVLFRLAFAAIVMLEVNLVETFPKECKISQLIHLAVSWHLKSARLPLGADGTGAAAGMVWKFASRMCICTL